MFSNRFDKKEMFKLLLQIITIRSRQGRSSTMIMMKNLSDVVFSIGLPRQQEEPEPSALLSGRRPLSALLVAARGQCGAFCPV